MDEVDNIIIHSLIQIGCKFQKDDESETFGLKNFTPDLLVRAVSKCLQEIKSDDAIPKRLPENMAQRFTVATSLAEMCSACGYRGDIGYQTFLYPNEIDIRRLFMFLIEQLPKDQKGGLDDTQLEYNKNDFDLLLQQVRKNIFVQLKSPWVPQYCRGISNRKSLGCSSLSVNFSPQLNLNVPEIEKAGVKCEQSIVTYQIPNIFQQISIGDYDLVSSVLHKNAIDLYTLPAETLDDAHLSLTHAIQSVIPSPVKFSTKVNDSQKIVENKNLTKTPIQKVLEEVELLKLENDNIVKSCTLANIEINDLSQQRSEIEFCVEDIKKKTKIMERTSVILESPEENINKLECLIEKTRERRLAVENQWQLHRTPALKKIEELKKIWQSKNLQSLHELKSTIQKLQKTLLEKNHNHAVLEDEWKNTSSNVASRKEYTHRIYEFISNIRKQRNDIYKILDDTKDLQKQLNSVSAQLQRQFNYTDDLLFQSAKHDLHAKQAYKLLATLHASCNDICDLVSRTGQTTKESRDLEVQIVRERTCNVAASLEKITLDIRKFEMIIKSMNLEINQVENEIN